MQIYWRLRDIPELSGLEKAQQTEIWAATTGRRFRDPFFYLGLIVCLVVVAIFYTLGCYVVPSSYGGVIGGSVGAGLGGFLSMGISMPRARPYLAEEIRRRSW